jgi:electron-transferring-flavoprotein dehydrogenase
VIKLEEGAVFPKGANVIHTMGYPLESKASGGGFVYRMSQDLVSLGLVIGLDYEDPLFEPHDAFLRFKRHPLIHSLIKGGKVKQQGAKTLPAGGLYSMPKVFFDGGLVVGDSAGVLNTLRLKGIHTAMKSGILAAETILTAFERDDFSADTLQAYSRSLDQSWIKTELLPARNFSQAMARPIVSKLIHLAAQQVSGGRGLVDPMAAHSDHARMKPGRKGKKPAPLNGVRPETDDDLFVDKLTGVFLSGTQHEEDQPCHLIIVRPEICHTQCAQKFDYPCVRFCPGNVYETRQSDTGELTLHLNPSNCLHCKTCEIKDPFNNILWTCPEGGGGPAYTLV